MTASEWIDKCKAVNRDRRVALKVYCFTLNGPQWLHSIVCSTCSGILGDGEDKSNIVLATIKLIISANTSLNETPKQNRGVAALDQRQAIIE